MSHTIVTDLKSRYEQLKAEQPSARIRNAAEMLHVSEADLVALNAGSTTTVLRPEFQEILKELLPLGELMALTRNDSVVHERKGLYDNVSFQGPVGLAVNPDIDLRIFLMHWKFAFAVTEGERHSIQFFDKSGTAVHKIYLTAESDPAAYHALVDRYAATEQSAELITEAYPDAPAELPDADIDIAAFQESWKALKDTHEFFALTRTHKLTRTQALRLAPEGYVRSTDNRSSTQIAAAGSRTAGSDHGVCGKPRMHPDTFRYRKQAHGNRALV
ncbi:MAG: ChuX/HutX family heme-like substrate-binding protein [Chitinophagaceae bacterium]